MPLLSRPYLALLMGLPLSLPALSATFRYSTSNDRIYVENGGTATLSQIKQALPKAPLDLVDASRGIWLLRANLFVEDGSVLLLRGTAVGGDVAELRLRSDSSGFVQLTADYGTLDIRSTRIRSWNAAANGPDTSLSDGRAFIRVRSRLASDGVTPLESRMDVIDSEVSHLGYNNSETQGLVWKVLGSTSTYPRLFDQVQVRGDIQRSYLHHNYYGVYTYGHQGGQWTDNEVAYNSGYGFDPHDDSDELLIENNYVHHNGNHGIIASKRCDRLVIQNNKSWDNKGNGIMLHRASDDSLVEGNDLRRNADSGVAIYASRRTTIRNNLVLDNAKAGMRFSNGAADSFVENNEIAGSGTYGFYFYKGSDAPEPGDDGRPRRNAFVNNLVRDGALEAIKLTDGDENHFFNNRFSGNNTSLRLVRAYGTELIGNQIPSDVSLRVSGTSSTGSLVYLESQPFVRLTLDSYSTATFSDPNQAVFDAPISVPSIADGTRSTMRLSSADIDSGTQVYTRAMRAAPSAGTVEVLITLWQRSDTLNKAWSARLTTGSASVAYEIGDLTPNTQYRVSQGTRPVGVYLSDANGQIRFVHEPGSGLRLDYTVTRA